MILQVLMRSCVAAYFLKKSQPQEIIQNEFQQDRRKETKNWRGQEQSGGDKNKLAKIEMKGRRTENG